MYDSKLQPIDSTDSTKEIDKYMSEAEKQEVTKTASNKVAPTDGDGNAVDGAVDYIDDKRRQSLIEKQEEQAEHARMTKVSRRIAYTDRA